MSGAEPELLGLAALALAALVLGRLAEILRVPDVVLFLVVGLAIGLIGLHPVSDSSAFGRLMTTVAASYVLYQGGLGLQAAVLRSIWVTVVGLATIGVVVTMLVVGFLATPILGVDLLTGLLVGAVLAATDPAVLIPVYRRLHVDARVAHVVIAESALNDATGSICTALVVTLVVTHAASAPAIAIEFVRLAGVGVAIGFLGGLATAVVLREEFGLGARYTAVAGLSVVVLAYTVSEMLGGSGLMAAFVVGLVVGNHPWVGAGGRSHVEPLSMMLRGLLFLSLGDTISLTSLVGVAIPALTVVAVLVLVARPLAVLAGAAPDRRSRWTWQELTLFAWARETGVVPGALAALLLANRVPGAGVVSAVTAVAIIATVTVQGTTTGMLARKLGLAKAPPVPA
ncbi:MAG: cation:proton antiporter [Candidatus Dormibacteraceae bacterium]